MEQRAYLNTVQALDDLRVALSRFAAGVQDVLTVASAEAAAIQAWVDQRARFWQGQVYQAEHKLRQAQAALHRCVNQPSRDRDGHYQPLDCRREERQVVDAEVRLRETRISLAKAQQWQMRLEAEMADYQRHARRLQALSGEHTPRTRAFLDNVQAAAERYMGEAMSGGIPSSDIPILSGLAQAVVGVLPGDTAGAGFSAASGSAAGTWVDRGIQTIQVADLPDPEGVTSEADFQRASSAEMQNWLEKLQTISPLVESGKGAGRDYWVAFDEARGLDHKHGYLRVYDVFYGTSAIKVEWDGSRYDVAGGRHRVWLAKRLGIETLPVRLKVRL